MYIYLPDLHVSHSKVSHFTGHFLREILQERCNYHILFADWAFRPTNPNDAQYCKLHYWSCCTNGTVQQVAQVHLAITQERKL